MASEAGTVLIDSAGDSGVLNVRSELTFGTVRRVLEQSRALFNAADGKVMLDLSEVSRADSAGLALLMEWVRMARARNIDIHFRQLPEQLRAIARASDLERLIPLQS